MCRCEAITQKTNYTVDPNLMCWKETVFKAQSTDEQIGHIAFLEVNI